MTPRQRLRPAEIEAARLGYGDLSRDVGEVAASLGIHDSTLYALAKRHGWPPRRVRTRPATGPGDVAASPHPPGDLSAQLATLERLAAQTVSGLEAALLAAKTTDPERAARALAIHVRTLGSLQKLQAGREQEPAHDEPPPRSLPELRDELRRHLERMRTEGRARRLRGRAGPGGDRGDARPLADPVPPGATAAGDVGGPD